MVHGGQDAGVRVRCRCELGVRVERAGGRGEGGGRAEIG